VPVTVIVEPDPGGHRFQYVSHVVGRAVTRGDVVLLTSTGAASSTEFQTYLGDAPIKVDERFTDIYPPTAEMVDAVVEYCASGDVETVFVMDADKSLKRWWRDAAGPMRRLARRPKVVFLLTRYPARLSPFDRIGWMHRIAKGSLSLLAMSTGTLSRVVSLAGRDDMGKGTLVKLVRDPAICGAHSRDRASIRDSLDLPQDRKLVGIFGVISDRKNVPLVAAALELGAPDAQLLLAGQLEPDVATWLEGQPQQTKQRIRVFEGFLSNDVLDLLVAASDVVVIAQNNNGPSGIMGKAVAAGVPVLSAGSKVRARELAALDAGLNAELEVTSLAGGLRELLSGAHRGARAHAVQLPTAQTFADTLFGNRSR
jgi:glycosyltransferase involved in cell wall biosynthesis